MKKMASPTGKSTAPWESILRAHVEAKRRYEAAASAAQANSELEDEACSAFEELAALENQALSMPADSVAAFRFKIALWGDGRVEGYEPQWEVFVQDCERLLLEAGASR